MDDLVQWLRAQLNAEADEAQLNADAFGAVWTSDDEMESVSSDTGADVVSEPYAPRSFIATHDPARVLREVDAKRRMIGEVLKYEAKIDGEWGCCHEVDEIAAGECPEIQPQDVTALRLLAAVYADRLGYQEAWRP
jgi:hypothetical protein